MINRKIQPSVQKVKDLLTTDPKIIVFPNGIKTYVICSGQEDLIKIELIFKAGTYFQQIPLQSFAVSQLTKEGTKNYSSSEIAGKVDYHGAFLDQSSGKDVSETALFCLSKSFDALLPVFEEIIKYPVFPEREIEIFLQNEKQEFLVSNQKVRFLATRKFNELLFGHDHSYGKMVTEEDFDNITRQHLIEFHQQYYGSENCYIIISGKFPDRVLKQIDTHFGLESWGNNTAVKNQIDQFSHAAPGSYYIKKNNSIQNAVRIGKTLFNKTHSDYFDLMILNTIIGGYFGSRLMTNIREDKGYTYGIRSNLVSYQKSGYFVISSEIGSEYIDPAMKEIEKEILRICDEPLPEKELELVKNYMVGVLLRNLDGPFAIGEAVKSVVEYGLGIDYYDEFLEKINSVTSKELTEMAKKYLDPTSMISLIAGNSETH